MAEQTKRKKWTIDVKAFDSLPVDVGATVRARLGHIQMRARAVGWGWTDAVDEVVHALDARAARVGTRVRATRPAG